MKLFTLLSLPLFFITSLTAQVESQDVALDATLAETIANSEDIGTNGFKFEDLTTGINSKYSDYGSGLFMEKFISFSARKIGAISKKDSLTNEPFTKLYCSDILEDYDLTRPLLFSRILNKNENLGTVTFSQDGNTMYFTKNNEDHTQQFQLYKAKMNPEKVGEWIELTALPFNSSAYSIENPHLSKDGRTLYFASNMPSSKGGFDIFKVDVLADGSYSEVLPIQGLINTAEDEKYPHLSVDQKFLFFSSKAHDNFGGYDVFKSRRTEKGYVTILNLGNTINTPKDEIAFVPATERIGYITSNKDGGEGSYDIYRITEYMIEQNVTGTAMDFDTRIPMANVELRLFDTDGTEVGKGLTDANGFYSFPISPFEYYTVVSSKEGFYTGSVFFNTDNKTSVYNADVTLKPEPAPIVQIEEKSYIKIDNILFDYDSATIKDVSKINLNSVVATLNQNPDISIALGAHTDFRGNDTYNLKLSEKRAQSAMNYLISKGVSQSRLTWEGYGEQKPLIDCDPCTEAEHESNRRIEFLIVELTN